MAISTRRHMSQTPVKFGIRRVPQHKGLKPHGFWYSIGDEWREWVANEMPHWLGEYHYEVELGDSKVLVLDTTEKLIRFGRDYSNGFQQVDWGRVAETYDGIEINPYRRNFRMERYIESILGEAFLWYYAWDVASGCIWNTEKTTILAIQGVPSINPPAEVGRPQINHRT
jgi:hypothetical protein